MISRRFKDEQTIGYWALGLSLAAHLAALAATATMRFSSVPLATARACPVVSVQAFVPAPEPVSAPKAPEPSIAPNRPEPTVPPPIETPRPTPATPSAEPTPEPQQPPATVWFGGQETAAQRICFIVDGSGSMNGLMYLVRDQLRWSIGRLDSGQAFEILFAAQNGRVTSVFGGRLKNAAPDAKAAALSAISRFRPQGQTEIEAAVVAALAARSEQGLPADVIYLVTDGFDLIAGKPSAFLERLAALRTRLGAAPTLHTVGVYPMDSDRALLRQIAEQFGGQCLIVE